MTMSRARPIVALLLPAFWLTAWAVCPRTQTANWLPGRHTPQLTLTSKCAGKHDCSGTACSLDQMIRRLSRRPGTPTRLEGSFIPLATSPEQFAVIEKTEVVSGGFCSPAQLAKSWQFLQRAALLPRAPSHVS
jgi:hypothetical protein